MESTPRLSRRASWLTRYSIDQAAIALRIASATVITTAIVIAAFSVTADARDIFPYRVFTVADETPVACGPGEAFYATDLLPAGTPLEVYRRDTQGWLAVRPPARSFSWIPARKLHISADERVATVVADDAVAWVGSHVETVSDHRWQVRLDRGERLAILGHRQLVDDKRGTTETWYQVEPPAGEFRWVHSGDVSRHNAKATDAAETVTAPATTANRRNGGLADGPATGGPELNSPTGGDRALGGNRGSNGRVEPAQFRVDPLRGTNTDVRNDQPVMDWSPRSRARSAADERTADAGLFPNGPRTHANAGPAADTAPLPVAGPAIASELEDLTLQLNAIAQREPNLWNLGPLRARTEALIDSGSNALERGKARLMLEKIEEFEQLQQRHIRAERGLPPVEPNAGNSPSSANQPAGFDFVSAGMGRATGAIANIGRGPSGLGPALGTGVAGSGGAAGAASSGASPRIEPRFDGTGWLLPVHSTKRVAPPYALLDDNGKVLQYVTPAPGLNLHRYERRRVGLYGQKTPAPSLNAPHLTAHRLVDLERHARKP